MDREYREMLLKKLQEEALEVAESEEESKIREELADILEVIDALCVFHQISFSEIQSIQERKRKERGGLKERIILDEVKRM